MTDPYIVLGVPQTATEEQVRAAYKRLAKKYHSESLQDSETEIIEQKMAELNAAYDEVIRKIKLGAGNDNSYSQTVSEYADVRRLISAHRLDDAEEILDGVAAPSRNAEWNYLKGCVLYKRGWLDEAANYISKAYNLDSSNEEYRQMYETLCGEAQGVNGGYNPDVIGCSPCSLCSSIVCADMCCECFGGDLVPCC